MDIRQTRQLAAFAAQRLEHAKDAGRIVLIFSALSLGSAALVTLVNYLLSLQISRSGGLGNLGARSALSSVQTMLPMLQTLLVHCLSVGYLAAMLRLARGQYASPRTLKLGFDRFWPLLRLILIEGLIYTGIGFVSVYVSVMIFMLTPLSREVTGLLLPLMQDASMLSPGLVLDEALYGQLTAAMAPVFVLCAVVFCAAGMPILYQYRMAEYVLIDRPELGALAVLRESRKMMRGNRIHLFKLDLHLWWYYAALLLASLLCYGDLLLGLLGIRLPLSGDAAYYLFYALYLGASFALYYFLRNHVEVTYALAYDSLRPQPAPASGGAVLGNIFQM